MNDLSRVIEATDSAWALSAIFLIGIYSLLWKFGGEMLSLARENNHVAKQAAAAAEDVKTSIITNRGSKNIGDAVDRLTEQLEELQVRFDAHLLRTDPEGGLRAHRRS